MCKIKIIQADILPETYRAQNVLIHQLKPDGKVISSSNKLLGRIDGDGAVWESMNKMLGRVTREGRVIDLSNRLLAKGTRLSCSHIALVLPFLTNNIHEVKNDVQ